MRTIKFCFTVWLISVTLIAPSYADDKFPKAGQIGVGVGVNALNFGLGPSVEYWVKDDIVASAAIGGIGDYFTIGVRGSYLFDKKVYGELTRPYSGIGYTQIEGPKVSFGGVTGKTKGSGIEVYGGVLWPEQRIAKNVFAYTELVLSTIDLESTITTPGIPSLGIPGSKQTVSADYGAFSIGFGLVYYFNK